MTNVATRFASHFAGRRLSLPALAVILGVAAPAIGYAQGLGGGSRMSQPAPDKPVVPAPDAVPGAKPREPAVPATRAASDLQPTDALFDAINRGDIASARDALNRGADMNGVNVLGMTPMELSVDLGRNDISFLLLSMRGEDSGRGSRAVARDHGSAPAKGAVPVKAARQVASARATAANSQLATKPIATPRLFANDGGTPLPSVGFLGFDSRSATN